MSRTFVGQTAYLTPARGIARRSMRSREGMVMKDISTFLALGAPVVAVMLQLALAVRRMTDWVRERQRGPQPKSLPPPAGTYDFDAYRQKLLDAGMEESRGVFIGRPRAATSSQPRPS